MSNSIFVHYLYFVENEEDLMLQINDDQEESSEKNQVLIGLMQEHRQSTKTEKVKMNQIAVYVYKVKAHLFRDHSEMPTTKIVSTVSGYTFSSTLIIQCILRL